MWMGDGDLDVLSASTADDKIAWYENTDGDGNFGAQNVISTLADGAYAVFAADIDDDGDIDALSASKYDDTIAWYENTNGDGTAWTARTITTGADYAHSVFAADVDGDGDIDALSASFFDDKIAWYRNDTIHRSAVFPEQTVISTLADAPLSVFAADVDGDGDLDVLSASVSDDKIAWYENTDGTGTFGPQEVISTAADGPISVFAADVDGDGDLDALSASSLDDKIAWYENTDGAGTFGSQNVITTDAARAWSVFAADLDGDGDLDVLSASVNDGKIAWYENTDGAGTFGPENVVSMAGNSIYSLIAADIDGDGDLDIIFTSYSYVGIGWHENTDGAGTFGAGMVISTAVNFPQSVFTADLDRDGDLDVLSASYLDDKIAWYENTDGLGSFGTQRVISTAAEGANSVFAVDLDRDGDLDVLSASYLDDKIAWYENTDGAGTFASQNIISTAANGTQSVIAADLNGDSDLDVLYASRADDTIAWYQNRGGQFALTTTDTAPSAIEQGALDDVLKIVMDHRGRSGDTDVELASQQLRFETDDGGSRALTSAEANALIDELRIYLDDGDGVFDPADESLVSTFDTLTIDASGEQSFSIPDDTSDAQLAFGNSKTFFAATLLASDASAQYPSNFSITHVTETSSTGEDAANDIPIALEFADNVTSPKVPIPLRFDFWKTLFFSGSDLTDDNVSGFSADPDDDGLPNGIELALGTDPTLSSVEFLPVVSESAGFLQITYRQRTGGTGTVGVDYIVGGLQYTVEVSPDLSAGSWDSGSNLVENIGTPVDNLDGTETVTVRLVESIDGQSRKFLRLEITLL